MQSIVDAVERLIHARAKPVLVALDGRSGSGKSTTAAALAEALHATIVPSDDFFAAEITAAEWAARSAQERARDAIDWRRLRHDALEPLLSGRHAAWYPFDFAAGALPDGTYSRSTNLVRRAPEAVIILDGAYSTRPELADLIDLSVLVHVPADIRLERLVNRDNPVFLSAWHAQWDGAEDFYFTHVRPPSVFDMVVDGTRSRESLVRHGSDALQ